MREPRDECRDVELPSGEVIRVRGDGELDAAGIAALGEVVDAARRLAAETPPDDGAAELYERIESVRGELNWRQVAARAGVRFSVLFRIGQGRMPDPADLTAIETWLTAAAPDNTNERPE